MSTQHGTNIQRRMKRGVLSFDIDDEDREHFYRQHGNPITRPAIPRPSRILLWVLGAAVFLLSVILLSGGRGGKSVDYSRFGYALYATDTTTLCNALLVFEALKRYGSKADRLLHYPMQWDTTVHNENDRNSHLLITMRDKYKVKLLPTELLGANGPVEPGTLDQEATWEASLTKLLSFKLTTYDRLLLLDTDITLLQHLDELFSLPPVPVAMPRAYWAKIPPPTEQGGQAWPLTSLMVLLKPSVQDFNYMMEVKDIWQADAESGISERYDMDLLNYRFGSSAMVLPQRPYALLSSEFRRTNHSAYLGEPQSRSKWDPDAVLKEAKLVHFSDWPLPKPWHMATAEAVAEMQPQCNGAMACRERDIWKKLYDDHRRRRRDFCQLLSGRATDWGKIKHQAGLTLADVVDPDA